MRVIAMATFRSQCSSSSMLLSTSVCQSHRDTLPHVSNQIDRPCNVPSDVFARIQLNALSQRFTCTPATFTHLTRVLMKIHKTNKEQMIAKNRTQYEKYYAERSTHCFPALCMCVYLSLCVWSVRAKSEKHGDQKLL